MLTTSNYIGIFYSLLYIALHSAPSKTLVIHQCARYGAHKLARVSCSRCYICNVCQHAWVKWSCLFDCKCDNKFVYCLLFIVKTFKSFELHLKAYGSCSFNPSSMKLNVYIEQGIFEILLKPKFMILKFYQFFGQNLAIFDNL